MKDIDFILTRAKEILFNLGIVYRTDDLLNNNEDVTQACSYTGYGLNIVAYDLPGIAFQAKTMVGLIPSVKQYMILIYITFKDSIVFDSGRGIYMGGIWEDVFNGIYNELPKLIQRRDEQNRIKLHCNDFMEKCFLPLYDRHIKQINGSIRIYGQERETGTINNCGSYEFDSFWCNPFSTPAHSRRDSITVTSICQKHGSVIEPCFCFIFAR